MEMVVIYGMVKLLGYKVVLLNVIFVNCVLGIFSEKFVEIIEKFIVYIFEIFIK